MSNDLPYGIHIQQKLIREKWENEQKGIDTPRGGSVGYESLTHGDEIEQEGM